MEETQEVQSINEVTPPSQNKYEKDELVTIYGSEYLTFKIIDFKKDEDNIYPDNKYNYSLELVEGTFVQDELPCVPECLLVKKN